MGLAIEGDREVAEAEVTSAFRIFASARQVLWALKVVPYLLERVLMHEPFGLYRVYKGYIRGI